jgi:hypothetical protein
MQNSVLPLVLLFFYGAKERTMSVTSIWLCWVDLNVGVRWETESPASLPLAP